MADIHDSGTESTVTGFILAGGRSSRMGADKAEVRWEGMPMLEHAKTALSPVASRFYVVGGKHGDIHDKSPFSGPGNAIANQLLSLPVVARHIALFVPVDMPRLTSTILQHLIEQSEAQSAPVYFDNAYLPVAIPLSMSTTESIDALLTTSREPSVRALLQALDARSLPKVGDAGCYKNINTPEDLDTAAKS